MADVTVDQSCNDPKELYGQGVRAYVLQDFEMAVAALSKASELLVAEHNDDLHESLGDVYLYYGKALLGLSRDQNEALGDAVPKNSADTDEEDEEQDEGIESEGGEDKKTEENSASSSVNGEAAKGPSDEPGPSSKEGQDEDDNDKEEEEDTANGDEDASDLQLAWEVLELAKKIFQKKEDKKSLSDTLIVLGEVSLESENFEAAINDIKQGLEVQIELFAKDSRAVAETLYKLGMAYSTNSQIDEAIDSFNRSLEYLRNRIKTLEEIKLPSQEQKDEIEEVKSLMPEIEDKIADMRVYKEEAIKKLTEAIKEPTKPTSQDGAGSSGASSSKPATNISHLVKRKRKIEETEKPVEEAPAKKPATEPVVNKE
ncbi:nuclear autoantigenic sperm protein-like [Anthonomus grandis grandis]|uniref:nuclear autoantigenic sperm protein-like n=1 Tax=Anthonomus grandis grandis TaxID=2921223 RepID=UPI0021654C8F|nr:nuclear autoantigenic sperm protein-like [Anthonomus grandis grandis]XP_050308581.1 nuclear autoantigenic sperm protein-like [Anthonomus grandis grandis]XP_050308582.1 nuclear autoantigenic sperm protein-like [Anthonomus grandis grandis]